jgi:large subunit ribosomal protein L18
MSVHVRRKELTARTRRQRRIRNRVAGTPARPRLNVFCSLKYIYAQVIDDSNGAVLASATSLGKAFAAAAGRANMAAAKAVGTLVAEAAKKANVSTVVFDRAGYRYHGRIKALAEAARAAGLQF